MSVSQPSYVSEATTARTSCCSTPTPTPTGTWPYSSVSGEKAWPTVVFVVESFLQTYKENASEPSLSYECKGGWSHTCHRYKNNKQSEHPTKLSNLGVVPVPITCATGSTSVLNMFGFMTPFPGVHSEQGHLCSVLPYRAHTQVSCPRSSADSHATLQNNHHYH